jgi:hypothetical protein
MCAARAGNGAISATPDWTTHNVVTRLRQKRGADGLASAQVFLDGADDEALDTAVHRLVGAAQRETTGASAEIGKMHRLARSFGVRATPDLIAALGRQPGVKAVLPAEIEDVFPRPVT